MVDPILTETEASTDLTEAWVMTDAVGDIQDISAVAAQLLNLSQRGARGRNLATFFVEDRPRLLAELLRAAEGTTIDRPGTLQPRDRKPVSVRVHVARVPGRPGDRITLRWVISANRREAGI